MLGKRTTLDVLNAQQTLPNSRASLIGAQRDEVVQSYALVAAMGGLSASDLNLNVAIVDPGVHFDQVKDKLCGVSTPDESEACVNYGKSGGAEIRMRPVIPPVPEKSVDCCATNQVAGIGHRRLELKHGNSAAARRRHRPAPRPDRSAHDCKFINASWSRRAAGSPRAHAPAHRAARQ